MQDALVRPMQYTRLKAIARAASLPAQIDRVLVEMFAFHQRAAKDSLANFRLQTVLRALPRRIAAPADDPAPDPAALPRLALHARATAGLLPPEQSVPVLLSWEWAQPGIMDALAAIDGMPSEAARAATLKQWIRSMSGDPRWRADPGAADYALLARRAPAAYRGEVVAELVCLLPRESFDQCMHARARLLAAGLQAVPTPEAALPLLLRLAQHFLDELVNTKHFRYRASPIDEPVGDTASISSASGSDTGSEASFPSETLLHDARPWPAAVQSADGLTRLLLDWRTLLMQSRRHASRGGPAVRDLLDAHIRIFYAGWLWGRTDLDDMDPAAHRQAIWTELLDLATAVPGQPHAASLMMLALHDPQLSWEQNEARRDKIGSAAACLPPPLRACTELILATSRHQEAGHMTSVPPALRDATARADAIADRLPVADLAEMLGHYCKLPLRRPYRIHRSLATDPFNKALLSPDLDGQQRETLAMHVLQTSSPIFFDLSDDAQQEIWRILGSAGARTQSRMLADFVTVLDEQSTAEDRRRWLLAVAAMPENERLLPVRRIFQCCISLDIFGIPELVEASLGLLRPEDLSVIFLTDPAGTQVPCTVGVASLTILTRIPRYKRITFFHAILDMTAQSLANVDLSHPVIACIWKSNLGPFARFYDCLALLPEIHRASATGRIRRMLGASLARDDGSASFRAPGRSRAATS